SGRVNGNGVPGCSQAGRISQVGCRVVAVQVDRDGYGGAGRGEVDPDGVTQLAADPQPTSSDGHVIRWCIADCRVRDPRATVGDLADHRCALAPQSQLSAAAAVAYRVAGQFAGCDDQL